MLLLENFYSREYATFVNRRTSGAKSKGSDLEFSMMNFSRPFLNLRRPAAECGGTVVPLSSSSRCRFAPLAVEDPAPSVELFAAPVSAAAGVCGLASELAGEFGPCVDARCPDSPGLALLLLHPDAKTCGVGM